MSEKNTKQDKNNLMEKIVSLCKRRGFVFQGSEIYGGLAGFYDYGHYGLAFANNIKNSWWKKFNEMFKTQVGVGEDALVAYLRPETAQGMFVNFKNTVDAFHPKLPFGMAQIGKAFRNEIAPRDFIFREREFEQMEIEYFVRAEDWEKYFEYWRSEMLSWMEDIGLDMTKVHELEVGDGDRAHYSKRTIDFEFDFPFGRKELYGLAYRTDFDLKNHKLDHIDEEKSEKIIPHVIEPSMGVDRSVLALLLSAYTEEVKDGETRPYLKLKPNIAPVICAVSPLLKNKP